jgi:hypothetical protein
MTETKPPVRNFYDLAKALGRWDNEGGAIGPPGVPDTALSRDEERILKCLGAAVIMQWNDLPTGIQRDLFVDATSMSDPARQFRLKQQIARFLHDHKDDA